MERVEEVTGVEEWKSERGDKVTTKDNCTHDTGAAEPRLPLRARSARFHQRGGAAPSTFPLFHSARGARGCTGATESRLPSARRSRAFHSARGARGFTLVELLLVIAVIGILAGFLFNAVFGVTKQANEKRNENNRLLLQAAIMEYRHDVGKWPIPDKDASASRAQTEEYQVAGEKNFRKRVVWKQTYGAIDVNGVLLGSNNDVIVEHLLNGKVGSKETKKSYIDLRPFLTTEKGTETRYLTEETEETMSADEARRNGASDRKAGKHIPLVYRAQFVKCPICGTYQTEGQINGNYGACINKKGCHDTLANPDDGADQASAHFFSKAEIKRKTDAALPYKVTFDFVNNTCSVNY